MKIRSVLTALFLLASSHAWAVDEAPTQDECHAVSRQLFVTFREVISSSVVRLTPGNVCFILFGFKSIPGFKKYVDTRIDKGLDPTHEFFVRGDGSRVRIFVAGEVEGPIRPE